MRQLRLLDERITAQSSWRQCSGFRIRQIFVAEHDGHSYNCVVTINCLRMSAGRCVLPQLCAAVPQYFQPHFLWLKMAKQYLVLRLRALGDKQAKLTILNLRPTNSARQMDVPMNVPVDDPNADTEWYEFLLLRQMRGN
jgi:hypothetical protein